MLEIIGYALGEVRQTRQCSQRNWTALTCICAAMPPWGVSPIHGRFKALGLSGIDFGEKHRQLLHGYRKTRRLVSVSNGAGLSSDGSRLRGFVEHAILLLSVFFSWVRRMRINFCGVKLSRVFLDNVASGFMGHLVEFSVKVVLLHR